MSSNLMVSETSEGLSGQVIWCPHEWGGKAGEVGWLELEDTGRERTVSPLGSPRRVRHSGTERWGKPA